MFAIQLANLLDELFANGAAFCSESTATVSASGLTFSDSKRISVLVEQLGWLLTFTDSEGSPWGIAELHEEFAPFTANIEKPFSNDLCILTNTGFAFFLKKEHPATVWRVAGLQVPLITRGRQFLDWDTPTNFVSAPQTKSPRQLVREHTATRNVPDDIRPWILVDKNYSFVNSTALVWANAAVEPCLLAIADEVDTARGQLKFRGPPKLTLHLEQLGNSFEQLGGTAFMHLQEAVEWVYESEREAEIRHTMFSSELARTGQIETNALLRLKGDCADALEGAKIAYQMSISDLGKDTLKALSDLKKAISEDTAKVADSTRQTVTAVASALALGLGLVAARLTTNTPPWLLIVVMMVVLAYVGVIIYSGYDFIKLQRTLRADWQPRLYRFLPTADYERMVAKPAKHAERVFIWCARIGGGIVVLLLVTLVFLWPIGKNFESQPKPVTGLVNDTPGIFPHTFLPGQLKAFCMADVLFKDTDAEKRASSCKDVELR